MNDLDPVSPALTTFFNVVDWVVDQINLLCLTLLVLLLGACFLLGITEVGVCGAHA